MDKKLLLGYIIILGIAIVSYWIIPSLWVSVGLAVVVGLILEIIKKLFEKQSVLDEKKLGVEIARESQRLIEESEKQLSQNRLILNDLENWINKTSFIHIYYNEGEFRETPHQDPDLDCYDEVVKKLGKYDAYSLWKSGKKTSETLKNKGKKAIEAFHTMVETTTEPIPLKKSYKIGILSEPYMSILRIREAIFDEINGDHMEFSVCEQGFLCHGEIRLARGKNKILNDLKDCIEGLIEDEIIRKQIKIYKEAKRKLDLAEPFKEFKQKLSEITNDFRYSKVHF